MKTYLKSFEFLGEDSENDFFSSQRMTCFNNFYPFQILQGDFKRMNFEPITILYGGNGSGKSTVLNIIAEKLKVQRNIRFNKTNFFDDYTEKCNFEFEKKPKIIKILTSDDVFDSLFSLRERNEKIDEKRNNEIEKRTVLRQSGMLRNIIGSGSCVDNYERIKEVNDAWSKTASSFVKGKIEKNLIGKSNGESALDFFSNEINEAGLYLLDEPENSLSAPYQAELASYLFDSARFFGAQFIIATHSPFMLSLPNVKIYNLDTSPVSMTDDWTSLKNMRSYYELFKYHAERFERQ